MHVFFKKTSFAIIQVLVLIISLKNYSQKSVTNEIKKTVATSDSIVLHTNSIQPFGFKIYSKKDSLETYKKTLDSSKYHINYPKGILYLSKELQKEDSIHVRFFKYPDFLTQEYQLLNPSLIVEENISAQRLYKLSQPLKIERELQLFKGLNTSGNITRSIAIGNNQNAVLNSELNLQISGKLSENITLKATIQDANLPTQNVGYSQNLQEFDQVFIAIDSPNWNIRAGDITVSEQNSRFGSFSKKLQGLQINTQFLNDQQDQANSYASFALVRGVFRNSEIKPIQGNQGPYFLFESTSENALQFILSNSETVYVNGLPLKKGTGQKYTINYNTAQIEFKPNFPISSDMRIRVTYQYSNQSYNRLLGSIGAKIPLKNWQINGQYYIESDLKNQALQEVNAEQSQVILKEAGDNPNKMQLDTTLASEYTPEGIHYENIGTEINPIYQYYDPETSLNIPTQLYQLKFQYRGTNKGDYLLLDPNKIDRIYVYTPPINGVPQGNFTPTSTINAPSSKQILVLKTSYKKKQEKIQLEFATSIEDQNTFSELDDTNNTGNALELKLEKNLWKTKKNQLQLHSNLSYIDKNFRGIELITPLEFNRNWNISPEETTSRENDNSIINTQKLLEFGANLKHLETSNLGYSFEILNIENYTGQRHHLEGNLEINKWKFSHQTKYLNTKSREETSIFTRTNSLITYQKENLQVQSYFKSENNQVNFSATNNLDPLRSQKVRDAGIGVKMGAIKNKYLEVNIRYKQLDSVFQQRLQKVGDITSGHLKSSIKKDFSEVELSLNYQTATDFTTDEKIRKKHLNGIFTYQQSTKNRFINTSGRYQTFTGQIQQQDFTFVETDPTRGTHTWNDYNNNGIQELTEFEISIFTDKANYIKVRLTSSSLEETIQHKWAHQFSFDFSKLANNQNIKDKKNWISRWYQHNSLQLSQQVLDDQKQYLLDGHIFNKHKNAIQYQYQIQSQLFLNRNRPKYRLVYQYQNSEFLQQLLLGNQQQKLNTHELRFDHQFEKNYHINSIAKTIENKRTTENTIEQNYKLKEYHFTSGLSYTFKSSKHTFHYKYVQKNNLIGNYEKLNQHQVGLQSNWNLKKWKALTGGFKWYFNDFNSSTFSNVSFQMLEGLQSGQNYTWNVSLYKNLTKLLVLQLNYQGRKSENLRTIHNGTVSIKALF